MQSTSGESETICRKPSELRGGRVSCDSVIDCLFDDDLSGNNELEFSIDEGTQLDLNMVDLSIGDMDMHLSVHLGRGSSCNIRLASVCQPGMKKVFAFDTIHDEGNTLSRTKMAGINLGDGTLRFIGTSDVVNGAHGSDTRQEGRITNLSEGSRSEVSPALLIKDNEVNASHGAAVGAYDPEAMYYLMSRGLTEAESRRLITVGSLIPIIDSLSDKSLAAEVYNSLEALKI